MKNNIYGLVGIGVRNANWNAGFDKLPKRDGNDIIKGSSYALQYCVKNQFNNLNQRVFGLKTMQEGGTCTVLTQRYSNLFQEDDEGISTKDKLEVKQEKILKVRNNLLSCKDILNFGNAYTGTTSMSIKGCTQFTDGINKYQDTNIVEEQILSPFANPKANEGEGVTTSTIGTKFTTDEAHYVYDFSIFPKEYNKYINDGFKGYTEDDYNDFKNNVIICVSNYNSKAKAGCKNEFAMFIKVKEEENYLLDLGCLQDYVKVIKDSCTDKTIYDISDIKEILDSTMLKIENIEIYYNPRTIIVKGIPTEKTSAIDLITRKEI